VGAPFNVLPQGATDVVAPLISSWKKVTLITSGDLGKAQS